MEKFQKDAIGAIIRVIISEEDDDGVTAVVNLASVTQKDFIIRKPSGAVVTKTAVFFTDGSDGILQYPSDLGLLDETGVYDLQADLVFPASGYDGPTAVGSFRVLANVS